METNYPNLRRPKRKLCYLTNTESLPKWTAPLTVEDVDKMFDDLDPSSHNDDDLSHLCPLLQTFDTETNQCERKASPVPQEVNLKEKLPKCQTDPEGEVLHPATRSPSPKLDIDLDIPFKAHGPMKTSSPIEENMVVGKVEELDNEKDQVVTPLLFACDDDEKEKANTDPLPMQEPQCNGQVEEEIELESPPSTVVFSKAEKSSHKNKVEGSCSSSKESHPVKEKTPKKPQAPVLEGKRKTPRRENVDPPVPAERQEPELAAPKKDSERVHKQPSVVLSRVEKDMTAFLKKLRDAAQPKPACPRKSLSPVKEPTPPPPEPDDDFLILEDDRPLWFSIPSKTATSRKQKQSKTSSTDRDSSTDRATKESPLETAQKQQESEQANDKLGSQTVSQKTKKMKGKEKKNKVTEPENDKEELSRPEDLPAGDLREEEAPNKKKRLKKVPSKEGDKEEEQPKDTASRKTNEDEPTPKKEKKAQKSSDVKRSKSVKDGNDNAKTSRSKAVKGARKVTQGSDAGNTRHAGAGKEQSQSNEEHADAEDLGSPPEEEIINSEAPIEKDAADGKDKHNKLPAVSEKSSSDDCQTPGKRKRRQPGEWWLNHPITEETKVTDTQPTPKKSKQYNKKPSASVPSPVKTKKDRVLKKRNQTQPSPSSSQNTNKAKEKKTTQKKNRNTRGDKPNKVSHTIEAEQIEEQEQLEILDQGLDKESSPLVLTERDYSLNSGEQVFPRVYHHEKQSITPVPVSPRGPGEQLRAAEPQKRRRKPPRNWWTVDDMSEDISSQPQQREPKPHKERKKQSKQSRSPRLGTPKNGNMAVSSKPPGGTPVPPVKPKTVKRSLATMKDIFSAVTETPAVVSSRETLQNKRHKVSASPAVNVTVTDCASVSRTDTGILSMDADEFRKEQNSAVNHVAPHDSQTEDRLQLFRSGPSSMIELQQYEEDEDLCLPPARVPAALSISDLCAPPLKPLVLQSKDKANLAEWFQSLWPVDKGAEITPDKFDWYFYQGRAIGFLVDLNCGSICNGKILLGSYMKKPLWVDHSATTVFELITSSVSVVIDSEESRFHPGQSFMVPCGHAYSIQNVNAQPAVVYFTRILAESSD